MIPEYSGILDYCQNCQKWQKQDLLISSRHPEYFEISGPKWQHSQKVSTFHKFYEYLILICRGAPYKQRDIFVTTLAHFINWPRKQGGKDKWSILVIRTASSSSPSKLLNFSKAKTNSIHTTLDYWKGIKHKSWFVPSQFDLRLGLSGKRQKGWDVNLKQDTLYMAQDLQLCPALNGGTLGTTGQAWQGKRVWGPILLFNGQCFIFRVGQRQLCKIRQIGISLFVSRIPLTCDHWPVWTLLILHILFEFNNSFCMVVVESMQNNPGLAYAD